MYYKLKNKRKMKTTFLTLLLLTSSLVISFGQNDFKWEKTDTINKIKPQIYSDTKLFIAETWKSAQDVIQNDDKESGMVLIKGTVKEQINYGLTLYTYYYGYTVTFLMKDNKFKMILNNVTCNTTVAPVGAKYTIPCIPPFEGENYPDVPNWGNLSKKKQKELMDNLKTDLQNIVDSYLISIKKQSINSGW